MAYYLNLFSPETYEIFSRSDRTLSGFRIRQHRLAQRIHPGDTFICYMTKLSRWIGVLEIVDDCFVSNAPLYFEQNDPYVVRFRVNQVIWLELEITLPIHEDAIWNSLSFTQGHSKTSSAWTGKFRSSLGVLDDEDARLLEAALRSQQTNPIVYPVDQTEYRKLLGQKVRRTNGVVSVSVPEEQEGENGAPKEALRESAHFQALLAQVGESMGCAIWLPRNDRSRVLKEWNPAEGVLLDTLPLNYDEVTLKTIEQIDVLWLKRRAIVRAFEVEHSTAVYSGILRMADLLALQPNMDIKLHIVAPSVRRDKVFHELQRPVFSLLDKGPLSELCTFISYDSLSELSDLKHLSHTSDSILEEYEEVAE